MNILIEQHLFSGTQSTVTLPDEKTWDDVESFFVSWDELYVKFKGEENQRKIPLNSETLGITDWKRPMSLSIYPVDEEGNGDYGNPLEE